RPSINLNFIQCASESAVAIIACDEWIRLARDRNRGPIDRVSLAAEHWVATTVNSRDAVGGQSKRRIRKINDVCRRRFSGQYAVNINQQVEAGASERDMMKIAVVDARETGHVEANAVGIGDIETNKAIDDLNSKQAEGDFAELAQKLLGVTSSR